MASDQTLAEFRMRVAQLRRQRWRQIEYSEDPSVALLYMPDDARDTFRSKAAGGRSGGRSTGWRKVHINEAGKVVSEEVEPPEVAEPVEAEAPEEAGAEAAPEE